MTSAPQAPGSSTSTPSPQTPPVPEGQRRVSLAILGVLGSGIGALGYITFVGAAITIARFRGAGVPGVDGVAHVPRSELIAVGADQLFAPIVIGLLVALLASLAYHGLERLWPANRDAPGLSGLVSGGRLCLGLLAVGALSFYRAKVHPQTLDDLKPEQSLPLISVATLLLSGAVGAAVAGEHRRKSQRLSWSPSVAVILFVTAAIFGGLLTYARNLDHPKVRTAAVTYDKNRALAGIFVGESGSSVYLARVFPRKGHPNLGSKSGGYIITLPRAAVDTLVTSYFDDFSKRCSSEKRLLAQIGANGPQDICPPVGG